MPTYSQCTSDQQLAYLNAYLAAGDLMGAAQAKFDTLADEALTDVDRSSYMASSLEIQRDLELLKNQYRAFTSDTANINPPDAPTVQKIQGDATALAAIIASTNTVNSILTTLADGKDAFDALNP